MMPNEGFLGLGAAPEDPLAPALSRREREQDALSFTIR